MTMKVLVVEDNDDVRAMVVAVLHMDPGITLFEAVDGSDAVDLAARERPQVVVTDIMMPRMDGLEATKRIKLAGQALLPNLDTYTRLQRSQNPAEFAAGPDSHLQRFDRIPCLLDVRFERFQPDIEGFVLLGSRPLVRDTCNGSLCLQGDSFR